MKFWASCWFGIAAWVAASSAFGQTITWNSDSNTINQMSNGQLMDGSFRFELGVFAGSFVPTAANKSEWAAHWKAARRTPYVPSTRRFSDSVTPLDNEVPFLAGTPSYVWGFNGNAIRGEWILFRSISWLWPEANPPVPPSANAFEWFAKNATVVAGVGVINASGSPFFMRSSAVANAAPPTTNYIQWQADELAGESLKWPGDDPDGDGSSNLLEYIFDTPPRSSSPPAAVSIERVGDFLQVSIPRRIDRKSILTVEVSDDLSDWHSGTAATALVSDGLLNYVVRDLTPLSSLDSRRFIRVKAEVSNP